MDFAKFPHEFSRQRIPQTCGALLGPSILEETASSRTGIHPQFVKLLFRGREHDDGSMLLQAGVKDGAKLSIAETTAYREHQAQAQALQEQEAMTQRQQAQAVQQEIREQQTMKLQVDVITAQVNQLAEQVC
ncbi:hypothetical protein ABBQ32_004271 [Trebouxia sp. C0010 RCD-2024]